MKPDHIISVVIPTCREAEDSWLQKIVTNYPQNQRIEYIIVDSETHCEIKARWKRSDFKILVLPKSNRAQRLKHGFQSSRGEIIIFHHPRSYLESNAFFHLLRQALYNLSWGGFHHKFDSQHWVLRFTSLYSNYCRPKTSRVVYLDHCIYFKRELLDKVIPEVSIFEDTEISKILSRHSIPRILPFTSTTSAIRFETNGVFHQAFINQKLKLKYFMGSNSDQMNKTYEKGLNLNE